MSHFFKISPSRISAALLVFVFLLTAIIIFLLPIFSLAKVIISILLVGALVYYLRLNAWLSFPSSTIAIRIEGNDIVLFTRDGSELEGTIMGDSLVTPLLTILNVLSLPNQRKISVIIFPDSLGVEHFRELRVLLKWAR